jgi:hypothetical protein
MDEMQERRNAHQEHDAHDRLVYALAATMKSSWTIA